jgi:hypothetical protein
MYSIFVDGEFFGQHTVEKLESFKWSIQFEIPPTPPKVAAIDLPPVISDVTVPSTLKAGSPIVITYRVRDEVSIGLLGCCQGYTYATVWQDGKEVLSLNTATRTSGDVKDGIYTVTYRSSAGLSGIYQAKITAYDKSSKETKVTSTDISIVP